MSWIAPVLIERKVDRRRIPSEIRDRLERLKHLSIRKAAKLLGINERTVMKYR